MKVDPPGGVFAGPVKRSVTIAGHQTSISLEPIFWKALETAAAERGVHLAHQPALAAGGGVRMDRPDLRGLVERGDGVHDGRLDLLRVIRPGGGAQAHRGLHVRLHGSPARTEDRVAPLRLADALLALRRAGAAPGAGRVSQLRATP